MNYENWISYRYFMGSKGRFLSFLTFISIAGVSVAVMALIVVLAVMSGFDRELKSKIVNVQPHLRIEKIGGMENPALDIQKIHDLSILIFVNRSSICKDAQIF